MNGLPYVMACITYRGQQLTLENVLLDTGSAGTIYRWVNSKSTILKLKSARWTMA